MRTTIHIGEHAAVDWQALRDHDHFLYRRIADHGRAVLGVGCSTEVREPVFNAEGRVNDWVFGALEYDRKNVLEPGVFGDPSDGRSYCDWFVPRFVVEWNVDVVQMHVLPGDVDAARQWIARFLRPPTERPLTAIDWEEQCSRTDYLAHVNRLLLHIHRGDIYEVNFCTQRTASATDFDPYSAFDRLLSASAAPFAGFYRKGDAFALCASPERYLAFDGDTVKGEPMKGTRPRSPDDAADRRLALELASDPKERSENIMALDVMRNDLSRIAASRTVKVDALCKVHSFPNVHQMVSVLSARLRKGSSPLDAIDASFPMASMTGAPKVRAMQLIQEYELVDRGLFSGSLGFFAPDGTGDFNVVIRTILHDARTGNLSLSTGSAITALSDPEVEWEECRLKARSVIGAINHA